jgi:anti-sigma factor ChrR (cupin superfamily)
MTALTPNVAGHKGLDPLASRYVDIETLAWEASNFPGVDFKTLLVDPETGILTTLVRMAPGATLPDHEHMEIEQTYVLEGRLIDDDGEVTSGNFVWRPARSRHSAHAPDGALLLGIFLKPNCFFNQDGSQTDFLGRDYDSTWDR